MEIDNYEIEVSDVRLSGSVIHATWHDATQQVGYWDDKRMLWVCLLPGLRGRTFTECHITTHKGD